MAVVSIDRKSTQESVQPLAAELRESLSPNFVFGAATSAYQIEGAVREDGRGESIWDRYCDTPGKVYKGHTGAVACDHYNRYSQDIALMRDLALDAYRFSIAWPRIFPHGSGEVNAKGLDFYERIVDALLASGIEPYATLFHWDLPQALQDRGGWYSRETAEAFAEYASTVADRLGDRVKNWITHNEPWCSSWLGHGYGVHAPGHKDGAEGAVKAAHHILLSHGLAVTAIRSRSAESAVGITIDLYPMFPESDAEPDRRAARHADGQRNRWFLDPVLRSEYPQDMSDLLIHLPEGAVNDMDVISAPLDFVGVNYYERQVIKAGPEGAPLHVPQSGPHADNGRAIYPDGLRLTLKRLKHEYGANKIYVTENGIGYHDVIAADGRIHDSGRADFLSQHLRSVAEACREGVNVCGYFAWSLMDNFEWSKGYDERERYGLVYVDRESLDRITKSSGEWYGDLIRAVKE